MMAVPIETNPVFKPGNPRPLSVNPLGNWDSSADGKRFLVAAPESNKPEPFTVLLNWQATLRK